MGDPEYGKKIQTFTGKSFSEALIIASIYPQYDERTRDCSLNYKKNASSEQVVYLQKMFSFSQNNICTQHITCSERVFFL